jgi:hypothetical protein
MQRETLSRDNNSGFHMKLEMNDEMNDNGMVVEESSLLRPVSLYTSPPIVTRELSNFSTDDIYYPCGQPSCAEDMTIPQDRKVDVNQFRNDNSPNSSSVLGSAFGSGLLEHVGIREIYRLAEKGLKYEKGMEDNDHSNDVLENESIGSQSESVISSIEGDDSVISHSVNSNRSSELSLSDYLHQQQQQDGKFVSGRRGFGEINLLASNFKRQSSIDPSSSASTSSGVLSATSTKASRASRASRSRAGITKTKEFKTKKRSAKVTKKDSFANGGKVKDISRSRGNSVSSLCHSYHSISTLSDNHIPESEYGRLASSFSLQKENSQESREGNAFNPVIGLKHPSEENESEEHQNQNQNIVLQNELETTSLQNSLQDSDFVVLDEKDYLLGNMTMIAEPGESDFLPMNQIDNLTNARLNEEFLQSPNFHALNENRGATLKLPPEDLKEIFDRSDENSHQEKHN